MENKTDIQYELDFNDVVQYQSYFLTNDPAFKRLRLLLRIIIPIGIVALIATILSALLGGINIGTTLFIGLLELFVVIYSIFFPKIIQMILRKSNNRVFSQKPNAVIGKHQVSINPEGFTDINETGQSTIRWNGISWLGRNDKYLFLKLADSSFGILPKRAFHGEANFNNFVETVKSYYEKNKVNK
ncbi:MAG TPA: YcxB family protein [Dehalococcoidales bacterium]|nr:YcxB family protein [Dehalococcoidales bacterium]